MSSTIAPGSAATARATTSAQPSQASLRAQLQRFEQQLSDCVNCASANTPRGKADIAAIAARISQVQQRLAQAADGPAQARAPAPAPGVNVRMRSTIDVYA